MSPGALKLKKLVQAMNEGVDMIHLLLGLTTSTDECNQFATCGPLHDGKESFYLDVKPDKGSTKSTPRPLALLCLMEISTNAWTAQ